MHRFLIVSALSVLAAAPTLAALATRPAAARAEVTTQLPRTVSPSHYDISITPDAANLRFTGKVAITIEILQPTKAITLNATDLTFAKVALSGVAAAPEIAVDSATQTATFTFAQTLAPGQHTLTIDYAGKIGTQATGLFALDYNTAAGKKRALYTQFENSEARRLIPSWDEPFYKATFTLQATVPASQMAVSNMPAASTVASGATKVVRFPITPKMSTYLLFFGAGEFERIAQKSGTTEIGVITQTGKAEQGRFALDSSIAILKEYNSYFGTPFPLPKLDNIAAPGRSQFFSAMENWGAIFTFEASILLDPTIQTQADKERSFAVAAHEMAHQWFGDLVTMAWWDDLWLNEGFASWMEGRASERLHPEWNVGLAAVAGRDEAMNRDALATTHPVVQHVETVEQASQAFDAITYQKGEAVIRMLEDYVGSDVWRDGVRRYIKAHAYGNTVTDDLWREVDAVSRGKPITEIAHKFTLQPGVPLIRVGAPACKAGATTLVLTQGEFSKDLPDKTPLSWPVPVIARTVGGKASARTVVTGGKGSLTVPGCGAVIVNSGQTGYYRTLYTPAAYTGVVGAFPGLAAIDQLGITTDSWALGLAGLQPASDVLELAKVTPATADPQLWGRFAHIMDELDGYYDGDAARQANFRRFAVARLAPVFAQVGWTAKAGEPQPVATLRNTLIATLGNLGDTRTIAEARRRYAGRNDPALLPVAIRRSVFGVVSVTADSKTWDELHRVAAAEKTPLIKDQLYDLLASVDDKALAQRALDLALTDEPGATNSASIIRRVSTRYPDLAFDFAIAHMPQVNERVDPTSQSRYFPQLAGNSSDPAMIAKVNAYSTKYLAPSSRRDADTAVANIAYRIKVRNERLPVIDAWLAKNAG
ncbi:M1 family metallopeptidase [Glacieibacterium sp.]|uniref:M1 family metallopeptidase n=1 Tax=Glacieibacterium sp. TaxID=2860237 RepID=UPI003B00A965